ncbi:MAG: M1 family metallopeptidase, partial [Cyclobacteriaceae bacterium]
DGKKRDITSRSIAINGTVMTIPLFTYIYPGESIQIGIEWEYPLPEQGLRQGVKGDSTFFIGYWYPQISVYDDLFGWDTQQYVAVPEFYNDFNDFNVTIKVPEGYYVWATGDLQNPEEVYRKKMLDRLNKINADSAIILIDEQDLREGNLLRNKTWKYTAKNVCDFAWSASINAIWKATMAKVDEAGNMIVVNSVYPRNKQRQNENIIDFAKASVEFFSLSNPAIPYPYPHHTTVNAWNSIAFPGGMEYPMMANNFEFNAPFNIIVTAHEIFHSYFPFYLGMNERKFTWMDEGWADFYDGKFMGKISEEGSRQYKAMTAQMWADNESGSMSDFPIMTTSEALTMDLYENHSTKPAVAFRVLENILGEEMLKKALQEFTRRWQGKHPSSHDFFYTINDVARQDLTWFWQSWFYEFGYPDLALAKDERGLTVKKVGNLPIPVFLEITKKNGEKEVFQETAAIWADGKQEYLVEVNLKDITEARLVPGLFPDKYSNNDWLKLNP